MRLPALVALAAAAPLLVSVAVAHAQVPDETSCTCPPGLAGPEDRFFYRPFLLENGEKGDVIAHVGGDPLLKELFHVLGSTYTHVQLVTEDKDEITHFNADVSGAADHISLWRRSIDPDFLGNLRPGRQTRTFDWSVRSYGLNLSSLVVLKPHDRAQGIAAADRARTLNGTYKLAEFSVAKFDGWEYGAGAQCASFIHAAYGGAIPRQPYSQDQRVKGSYALHDFAYRWVKEASPAILDEWLADSIAGQVVMCFTGWGNGKCEDTGEKWKDNPDRYVGSGITVSPDDLVLRSGSVFADPVPAVWSGGDFRAQPMCFRADDPDNADHFVEPTCVNYPPSVAVVTPSARSGRIRVVFRLYDRDSDPLSIGVSYCDYNSWLAIPENCRPASVVLDDGLPTALASSPAGVLHSLRWQSSADLVGVNAVEMKLLMIEVSDGRNPGAMGTSELFPVDNTGSGSAPFTCPNSVCDPGEDTWSCPDDCLPFCGNGVCENGENHDTCPRDCEPGVFCGDGVCTEDCFACPLDCSDDGKRTGCLIGPELRGTRR
jgi:hypothetical protein